MRAAELTALDAEELSGRLKGARRELYELRFKLAVGQLENNRQIRKVRKDIARILTVVHRRRLGEAVDQAYAGAEPLPPETPEPVAAGPAGEATPEAVEAADPAAAPPKKSRGRKPAREETE